MLDLPNPVIRPIVPFNVAPAYPATCAPLYIYIFFYLLETLTLTI